MNPAEQIAAHLRDCVQAQAAIVCDGSGDDMVATLVAAGWMLEEGAEYVGGKRIRTLKPPEREQP